MALVTTPEEMHALLFAGLQRALDETLLEAFRSDLGHYLSQEDVRCAWSNLPLAEKMDFVRDVFPTPLALLTSIKRTSSW